ncbi:MAG TPA: response regulator [Pyrinomonadaceae bacterium]|jgi:signal transduction histidine kinase
MNTTEHQTTILIVDDAPDRLRLTAELLTQSGYRVMTAGGGREAYKIAEQAGPDLIVSDVAMPVMDGIELCRMVRAHDRLRWTPILLTSALRKDNESVVEGLRAGADAYLEVPYDPERLITKIARLVERKALEEALWHAKDELEERVGERTRELQEMTGRLLDEVKEHAAAEQRVRELLRRIVNIQEEERRSIARELHDHLGQQLSALRLSLDQIKQEAAGQENLCAKVERFENILRRLDSDVDVMAWRLRPASLDQLGLSATLERFVREWSEQSGVEAEFHAVGLHGGRLPPEVEINLYRITQEALNNVQKHAEACKVCVLLERRDELLVLIVEDDGKGFDPDEEGGGGGSMGLINMRERAALINGRLEIESVPGAGATLFARVPL